jgi:heme exporter protein C
MTPRLAGAKGLKLLLGLWMAAVIVATFVVVPPIQGLGNVGRIFIIHVPTAWLAVLAFAVSAVFSILYLWRGRIGDDANAVAAAEAGFLYTLLATVTGAIFAQAVWGIFWNWDPRQTSIFVLLLIYGAYFALRSALDDGTRRRRLASVYALLAFVTVPFLMFVIPRAAESTLHPNCALLPGSKCEGITLGTDRTIGLLGDLKLDLKGVERQGDQLTAVVEVTSPGLRTVQTLRPTFDLAQGTSPDSRQRPLPLANRSGRGRCSNAYDSLAGRHEFARKCPYPRDIFCVADRLYAIVYLGASRPRAAADRGGAARTARSIRYAIVA